MYMKKLLVPNRFQLREETLIQTINCIKADSIDNLNYHVKEKKKIVISMIKSNIFDFLIKFRNYPYFLTLF